MPPFDTSEVIEAKSQELLNTSLSGCFQKWQKRWERRIRVEGGCFEGVSGQ
jgi:hypothetical protein